MPHLDGVDTVPVREPLGSLQEVVYGRTGGAVGVATVDFCHVVCVAEGFDVVAPFGVGSEVELVLHFLGGPLAHGDRVVVGLAVVGRIPGFLDTWRWTRGCGREGLCADAQTEAESEEVAVSKHDDDESTVEVCASCHGSLKRSDLSSFVVTAIPDNSGEAPGCRSRRSGSALGFICSISAARIQLRPELEPKYLGR